VLPGPDKHSRPHSPKTTGHFRSFQDHLSKHLLHDISKHNNKKQNKNIMFLLLLRPLSPPTISHRKLFFDTACFELFGGGHGHLATLTDL
jgi:hypothetical protein